MKKLIFILFLLILQLYNSQDAEGNYSDSKLYQLKLRIDKGDKTAFGELSPYFDSHTKRVEYLGHHYHETEESFLSKRIILENFILPESEFDLNKINSTKDFLEFLNIAKNKIKYSSDLKTFYITPVSQRKAFIEFRDLPKAKIEKLNQETSKILEQDWAKENGIDLMIKNRDAKCLPKISQQLYSKRDRFNYYNPYSEEMLDLLKILIKKDIGAVGRNDAVSWDTNDYNFDNNSLLNILIYFSKNHENFTWNEKEKSFINKSLESTPIDSISILFEDLYSENDSAALNSFIELSQSNPKRVIELSSEKDKNFLSRTNSIVPIFPFRFLKQISLLTEYYRQNNIDFIGSSQLQSTIEKLDSHLSFKERRNLEDRLINQLNMEDLTPIEYWSLIYEKKPNLSKSVSRILDIYYTKNWSKIISDNWQLIMYLKKSLFYSRIGINGNLNYYVYKFTGNGSETVNNLNEIKTDDPDLKTQIQRAQKICLENFDYPVDDKKNFDGNFNSQNIKIQEEVDKLRITAKDDDDFEYGVLKLFSKIGYAQIPEAIKVADKIKFKKESHRDKYSFLERDFGFFSIDNWKLEDVRRDFLSVYNTYNEKQLYEYYLDKSGVDYKNENGNISYDKIYEILKFNIVTPFTGSQELENEVGAIIKLLEINLNTTLGYPDKLCNSSGMYICPPSDRAWEWRKYLKENKLLKEQHSPIVSFNYGYYIDKVLMYRKLNSK